MTQIVTQKRGCLRAQLAPETMPIMVSGFTAFRNPGCVVSDPAIKSTAAAMSEPRARTRRISGHFRFSGISSPRKHRSGRFPIDGEIRGYGVSSRAESKPASPT